MKILVFSQVFYPDVVAVAQYTADLAAVLSATGHEVEVLCSIRAYDDPTLSFAKMETWKGVCIRRVFSWNLGKKTKLRRIVGFASFFISSFARLIIMSRPDVVVVVPPPPLLSVMAALYCRLRGCRLVYWNMDLNPDEAIAAGWMKPESTVAKLLTASLRFSLRSSSTIVVLDRFMKDRIVSKGVPEEKICVIPPWSHDQMISYDHEGRLAFRKKFEVEDKFIVMHSGNHSPLHPLLTLLQAAHRLRNNSSIVFMFVGGGSEFNSVKTFAWDHEMSNVVCLPYRPIDQLSASLSAADLQVVLLGDPFVGIVHPCKIYNILSVGSPFLYIGPDESHISDLREFSKIACMGRFIRHGDVDSAVEWILRSSLDTDRRKSSRAVHSPDLERFSQGVLSQKFIELIEAL